MTALRLDGAAIARELRTGFAARVACRAARA